MDMRQFAQFDNAYAASSQLSNNSWITDPRVPDPDYLPQPLGWTMLIRPYPIIPSEQSTIIRSANEIEFMNHTTQIGRVVAVGSACWKGDRYGGSDWVKEGDFVTIPKHVGARRKYKGVSYLLVVDDEILERLPNPQVMIDDGYYKIDVPEEHMKKFNTFMKEVI